MLKNIQTGPFINSLVKSDGLYGNFELSLKGYGIELLMKLKKYFMLLSARKTKTFQSTD